MFWRDLCCHLSHDFSLSLSSFMQKSISCFEPLISLSLKSRKLLWCKVYSFVGLFMWAVLRTLTQNNTVAIFNTVSVSQLLHGLFFWTLYCILCFLLLIITIFTFLETCNLNCVRKRTEKRLRKAIRTLRKVINKEQLHIRLAGMDHDVARKSPRVLDAQELCSLGQRHVDNRCGKHSIDLMPWFDAHVTCIRPVSL